MVVGVGDNEIKNLWNCICNMVFLKNIKRVRLTLQQTLNSYANFEKG